MKREYPEGSMWLSNHTELQPKPHLGIEFERCTVFVPLQLFMLRQGLLNNHFFLFFCPTDHSFCPLPLLCRTFKCQRCQCGSILGVKFRATIDKITNKILTLLLWAIPFWPYPKVRSYLIARPIWRISRNKFKVYINLCLLATELRSLAKIRKYLALCNNKINP